MRKLSWTDAALLVAGFSVSSALFASLARASAVKCGPAASESRDGKAAYRLGNVWSGVGTAVGAARRADGHVLAAFYDADRWVTIAEFAPERGEVCRVRLPSQFAGWDAHNTLALAISADGTLHVAGNAHASPLFYARGRADDLQTLEPAPMTGSDEMHATYPKFLRDGEGRLLFMYRSGGSGDGAWLLNRWDDGHWTRIGELFAAHDGEKTVSAYPSNFAVGTDGTVHVAIVWRSTPDVKTNFAVTYASTRDFSNWSSLDGTSAAGPLSPERGSLIERTGEGAGLMNGARLVLTPDNRPVVLYPRYGSDGNDAIVAATPEGGKWVVREIATSGKRTKVEGFGALSHLPAVFVTGQDGGTAHLRIVFPRHGREHRALDLQTMTASADATQDAPGSSAPEMPTGTRGMADVAPRRQAVTDNGLGERPAGEFEWFAQGANGDRPRDCTPRHPQACDPPPMPLFWSAQ